MKSRKSKVTSSSSMYVPDDLFSQFKPEEKIMYRKMMNSKNPTDYLHGIADTVDILSNYYPRVISPSDAFVDFINEALYSQGTNRVYSSTSLAAEVSDGYTITGEELDEGQEVFFCFQAPNSLKGVSVMITDVREHVGGYMTPEILSVVIEGYVTNPFHSNYRKGDRVKVEVEPYRTVGLLVNDD